MYNSILYLYLWYRNFENAAVIVIFFFKFYLIHVATVDQDFSKENIHKLPSLVGLRGRGGVSSLLHQLKRTPNPTPSPINRVRLRVCYLISMCCVISEWIEFDILSKSMYLWHFLAIYIFVIGLLLFWPRYFGFHGVRIIVVTSLYMWLYDKVRSN